MDQNVPEEKTYEEISREEKLCELDILKQSLVDKENKVKEYYEQLLRLRADFDNFRKRVEKEKIDIIKYGNMTILVKLLPILDNLERAQDAAHQTQDINTLISGLDLIYKDFINFLKGENVNKIDTIGEQCDPHKHDVVGQVESDEYKDNQIVEELQKGYSLHDRIIRHALVKVAKVPKDKDEDIINEQDEKKIKNNKGGETNG